MDIQKNAGRLYTQILNLTFVLDQGKPTHVTLIRAFKDGYFVLFLLSSVIASQNIGIKKKNIIQDCGESYLSLSIFSVNFLSSCFDCLVHSGLSLLN